MWGLIVSLIIGGVCGCIASFLMGSKKGGLLFYVIVGVLGGFVGSFVFGNLFNIGNGNTLWQIVQGVIGTCLLIFLYRVLIDKKI